MHALIIDQSSFTNPDVCLSSDDDSTHLENLLSLIGESKVLVSGSSAKPSLNVKVPNYLHQAKLLNEMAPVPDSKPPKMLNRSPGLNTYSSQEIKNNTIKTMKSKDQSNSPLVA